VSEQNKPPGYHQGNWGVEMKLYVYPILILFFSVNIYFTIKRRKEMERYGEKQYRIPMVPYVLMSVVIFAFIYWLVWKYAGF